MANYFDKVLTLGGGINTGAPPLHIKNEEAVYLRNMDSWKYPSAAVRPGRTTYPTILSTNAHTLGERNNETLMAVDGNTWKYWNAATTAWVSLTTALASTEAEMLDFATGTARYTILGNSTDTFRLYDGSTTLITVSDTNAPKTKIFTVNKGRIYAASPTAGKYCALNLTTDWTTANDAGSISLTRAKGAVTASAEYADMVIIWTEHSMHELYGTGPLNYQLVDVEGTVGCISQRSVIKVKSRIYWLWFDGVYEYNGGSPMKVSEPVDDYIENINFNLKTACVAGAVGDILYLAIPHGSGATKNNLVLKCDTRLKKWYVETGNFRDFVTIGNTLYGLDYDGQVWDMRDLTGTADSATPISWEFITKPFRHGNPSEPNTLNELWLVADISTGSTAFTVGYSTKITNHDSTTFTTIKTLSGSSETQNQRIILKPAGVQKQDWYRLRFAGTGKAEIHYLEQKGGITK